MSPIVTNAAALIGAFYSVFTVLHTMFPSVALFQRLGAAFRQLGPKP
jgi:hypothetical protein